MRFAPHAVVCVENSEYRKGMLSSLQAGLRSVPASCDGAIFAPVDHPAVASETLSLLGASGAPIVIPRSEDERGSRSCFAESVCRCSQRQPPSRQVRDVISSFEDCVTYVDVNDPGIFDDIDDPQLYRSLLARETGRS